MSVPRENIVTDLLVIGLLFIGLMDFPLNIHFGVILRGAWRLSKFVEGRVRVGVFVGAQGEASLVGEVEAEGAWVRLGLHCDAVIHINYKLNCYITL